jgi:hypothetical protein
MCGCQKLVATNLHHDQLVVHWCHIVDTIGNDSNIEATMGCR